MKDYLNGMKVNNTILNLKDTDKKLAEWKKANGIQEDAPSTNLGDFSAKLDEDQQKDERIMEEKKKKLIEEQDKKDKGKRELDEKNKLDNA